MKSLLFVCIVATCLVHSTFAYLETKREWPTENKKKLMIDRINNFNIVIMIMKKFTDQFHFSLNAFCTPFMLFFSLITADFIKTCQIYNVSEPEFVKCSTESIQALFDNINKGKLNVKV